MIDSPMSAAGTHPTAPPVPWSQRNPYGLALWGLTVVLFLTAFIVQKVGESRALIGGSDSGLGMITGATFDTETLLQYNTAAFAFLMLAVVCLIATLIFNAVRWKPATS